MGRTIIWKKSSRGKRIQWKRECKEYFVGHWNEALSCSWSSLLLDGRAKVPDLHGILAGSDLKVEVMEEKLLRNLTREICSLLSVLASLGLNAGHISRVDTSSLKDLDSFVSNSMVGFVLRHEDLAVPAMQITLDAFKWNDGEAVSKVSSFYGAVILPAISTNNVELQQFVCKDLFYAIIEGLPLESNAFSSADLVGLCHEIFIYLSDRDPAPREILLSLLALVAKICLLLKKL
ncbi:Protein HASTY 1 [Camellia lanceoleosa]|uniref:Protein HASTY 1 n=1 Tax=Camellia lanceoleosa TaxID=1840588 RepID=A0ACC0IIH4_9ERIC|nr:Protein HASTY 1 [Camellia lanceoleosa]